LTLVDRVLLLDVLAASGYALKFWQFFTSDQHGRTRKTKPLLMYLYHSFFRNGSAGLYYSLSGKTGWEGIEVRYTKKGRFWHVDDWPYFVVIAAYVNDAKLLWPREARGAEALRKRHL